MLKKLSVFCLICVCGFGLTIATGCSGGPAKVDVDKAMENKAKTFGTPSDGTTPANTRDGMRQVD